jgi:hypothetical protein
VNLISIPPWLFCQDKARLYRDGFPSFAFSGTTTDQDIHPIFCRSHISYNPTLILSILLLVPHPHALVQNLNCGRNFSRGLRGHGRSM